MLRIIKIIIARGVLSFIPSLSQPFTPIPLQLQISPRFFLKHPWSSYVILANHYFYFHSFSSVVPKPPSLGYSWPTQPSPLSHPVSWDALPAALLISGHISWFGCRAVKGLLQIWVEWITVLFCCFAYSDDSSSITSKNSLLPCPQFQSALPFTYPLVGAWLFAHPE